MGPSISIPQLSNPVSFKNLPRTMEERQHGLLRERRHRAVLSRSPAVSASRSALHRLCGLRARERAPVRWIGDARRGRPGTSSSSAGLARSLPASAGIPGVRLPVPGCGPALGSPCNRASEGPRKSHGPPARRGGGAAARAAGGGRAASSPRLRERGRGKGTAELRSLWCGAAEGPDVGTPSPPCAPSPLVCAPFPPRCLLRFAAPAGEGGPLCVSTRAPRRSGPGAAPPAAGRRDGVISAFGDEVQAFRGEEKNCTGSLGGGCTEVKPGNLMVGGSATAVQPGLNSGCGGLNCDIL